MHWILVAVGKPNEYDPKVRDVWRLFLHELDGTSKPVEGTDRLADNCWLIPAESGLSYLSRLIVLAERMHIPYRLCLLDKKLEWTHSLQSG